MHPPTLILRHARENLNKCSLRGIEGKGGFVFYTYPKEKLPDLTGYLVLKMGAPLLSFGDRDRGLILIDGTWKLAEKMGRQISPRLEGRSLPSLVRTAYPRRQTHCPDPESGLASIEALFLSYWILGRPTEGLLENYHWKERFLNQFQSQQHH